MWTRPCQKKWKLISVIVLKLSPSFKCLPSAVLFVRALSEMSLICQDPTVNLSRFISLPARFMFSNTKYNQHFLPSQYSSQNQILLRVMGTNQKPTPLYNFTPYWISFSGALQLPSVLSNLALNLVCSVWQFIL